MTVESLSSALLESSLRETRGIPIESDGLEPSDVFMIERRACELSLYGAEMTEALAARWVSMNSAQRLLALMLAERAPSADIVPMLEACTAPDQDYFLRREAVSALAAAPAEVGVPILEQLADDADSDVRTAVLKALRDLGKPGDVDALARRLGDTKPQVRLQAVHSLGSMQGKRPLIPLLQALDDPQLGVALAAKKHLLKRKGERDLALDMIARLQDFGTKGRYRLVYAIEILGALKDERAIAPLLEHLLVCRNNELKIQTAKALARFKSEKIMPGLWQLARDKNDKVQVEALKALKKHPHDDTVAVLRELVEQIERSGDCAVIVAEPLIAAMTAIPGEPSEKLLLSCAVSSEYRLIDDAVAALVKRKSSIPASALSERLAAEESDFWRERYRATYLTLVDAKALGESRSVGDKPETVQADGRLPETYADIGDALAAMSDEEVIRYASSQENVLQIHHVARDRLRGIDTPASSMQLRRFLKSSSIYDRGSTAALLESRGLEISRHDQVAKILCGPKSEHAALSDFAAELGDVAEQTEPNESHCTDEMIRIVWEAGHPYRVRFAMRWLGININGQKYGKIAFDCLKSEPDVSEPAVLDAFLHPPQRRAPDSGELALLLGRFRCVDAVDELIVRLQNSDARETKRRRYAEALGLIGDKRAIQPLIALLGETAEGPFMRKSIEALVRLKANESIPMIEGLTIRNPKFEPVREKALAKLRK